MMPRITPEDHAARLALYKAGMPDNEIAKALGLNRFAIGDWRRSRGWPANPRLYKTVSDDEEGKRRLFLALGWSSRHIARECGTHPSSIQTWRLRRGLDAGFAHGVNERHRPRPTIADVVEKCRRSVGRYLPRDIAEDAVADLMIDILTGKLALDKIGDAAKKYGNRVVAAFANKWGDRSLDMELGDSDGFTLLDMIADDNQSSWLEEMGATVW